MSFGNGNGNGEIVISTPLRTGIGTFGGRSRTSRRRISEPPSDRRSSPAPA